MATALNIAIALSLALCSWYQDDLRGGSAVRMAWDRERERARHDNCLCIYGCYSDGLQCPKTKLMLDAHLAVTSYSIGDVPGYWQVIRSPFPLHTLQERDTAALAIQHLPELIAQNRRRAQAGVFDGVAAAEMITAITHQNCNFVSIPTYLSFIESPEDSTFRDTLLEACAAVDTVQIGDCKGRFIGRIVASWYKVSPHVEQLVQAQAKRLATNTRNTNAFHFDNLNTYASIVERWQELSEWISEQASMASTTWDNGGREQFAISLGMLAHAIQDFYCHSNYFQLAKDVFGSATPIPTFTEYMSSLQSEESVGKTYVELRKRLSFSTEKTVEATEVDLHGKPLGGLQTGIYDPDVEAGTTLAGWKHRHPEGEIETDVLALAARDTGCWLSVAIDFLPESPRKDVLWLTAYEAPELSQLTAIVANEESVALRAQVAAYALATALVLFVAWFLFKCRRKLRRRWVTPPQPGMSPL